MTFPEITRYKIDTLDGRVIHVSSRDKSAERNTVLLHAEEDGDGNPFQFNLRRHDARVLACALNLIADVIDARKAKEKEA